MSDKIFLKEITFPILETGENETYSFVQTDADLDTAGDAADAKAVGDELTNLKQELDVLNDAVGVYIPPSASGTTPVTASAVSVLSPVTLVNGHRYKYEVTYANASDRASYLSIWLNGASTYYKVLTISADSSSGSQEFDSTVDTDSAYIAITPNSRALTYTVKITDLTEVEEGNRIDILEDGLDALSAKVDGEIDSTYIDVAEGATDQLTPYANDDLKYRKVEKRVCSEKVYGDVVAINHDDLGRSDYVNTRKIYNKYGFNANFNFILAPFSSEAVLNEKVAQMKQMVKDGNAIGLHAIFGESFWWMNKMYDVRPNYAYSFAPTLANVTTDVGDGKNVFGQTIDMTKPLSYYGFVNPPSTYANTPISDITASNWYGIIGHYTLYYNTSLITGLDLDGNIQSWKMIKWLEHWYNRLIDDTLGYSVDAGALANFASDYDMPDGGSATTYYPQPERIVDGKMVFFDDTDNPHYNESGYQKVGRVKQGLFKGSATVCNFEVRERCIEIARAFCRHYFGFDDFTMYGRHGVTYVNLFWMSDGVPYDDSLHRILAGEHGKPYNSIKQKFESGFDVLLNQGIKNTSHNTPLSPVYMGQYGLYRGQSGFRSPFFEVADFISYLTLAGETASVDGSAVNNDTLRKILEDKKDVLKYVYENAGQSVTSTDGTASLYIHRDVKTAIDKIKGLKNSGKIPFLSLDTIVNDASNWWAVELVCQYCYKNNIEIVPIEEARQIATSAYIPDKGNYIPNPQFTQSLLDMFGGESTAKGAYVPDGWSIINDNGNTTFEVAKVNNKRALLMTGSGTGYNYIITRIFGLPAGTYTLTFNAKATGEKAYVYVHEFLNSTFNSSSAIISTKTLTADDTEYTVQFTIDEPYKTVPDSSPASQYNDGYEKNVCEIRVQVGFSFGNTPADSNTITIYDMKLERS